MLTKFMLSKKQKHRSGNLGVYLMEELGYIADIKAKSLTTQTVWELKPGRVDLAVGAPIYSQLGPLGDRVKDQLQAKRGK